MYWFGWLATSGIVAAVAGFARHPAAGGRDAAALAGLDLGRARLA